MSSLGLWGPLSSIFTHFTAPTNVIQWLNFLFKLCRSHSSFKSGALGQRNIKIFRKMALANQDWTSLSSPGYQACLKDITSPSWPCTKCWPLTLIEFWAQPSLLAGFCRFQSALQSHSEQMETAGPQLLISFLELWENNIRSCYDSIRYKLIRKCFISFLTLHQIIKTIWHEH